jgi:hypothetical protein
VVRQGWYSQKLLVNFLRSIFLFCARYHESDQYVLSKLIVVKKTLLKNDRKFIVRTFLNTTLRPSILPHFCVNIFFGDNFPIYSFSSTKFQMIDTLGKIRMLRQLLFLGIGYVHRHKINRLVGSYSLHSYFLCNLRVDQ